MRQRVLYQSRNYHFIYYMDASDAGTAARFAVASPTDDAQRWGVPKGAKVIVAPSAAIHDFDIALVRCNRETAFKKLRWRKNGSVELMSDNGAAICVPRDEANSEAFAILGKAVAVISTPQHGL